MGKLLSWIGWLLVAVAGAGAFAWLALSRGEQVSAAWLVTAAVCTYLIAYRFYSRFIASKIFALDANRKTPAERLNDGRDYVPTNRWVVFGHHFAAIAGPGPLVGPTLAAQFGFLPGMIWILVGVSLGGAVGMHLALEAPERLDRLVLAATSARFGTPQTWDERIALVRTGGMEAVADAVLPRWFTPAFVDVQRFRAMLASTPPAVYVRYCEILREYDLRGRLGDVDAPTLAIAGAEDPTSPPDHLEGIATEIPDARVVVIPRGAHLVNVERADEFNDALLAHLA